MRIIFYLLCVLVLTQLAIAADSPKPAPSTQKRLPKAILVYNDKADAQVFADLLTNAGLDCELTSYADIDETWKPKADLIVFLHYSTKWQNASFLDGLGTARILACGSEGAALLNAKGLLIGSANAMEVTSPPTTVRLPRELLKGPSAKILSQPNDLIGKSKDDPDINICTGDLTRTHTAIYDQGEFPKGALGIGRASNFPHHWLICIQGNNALWGVNNNAANLTNEGKKLFANLCFYLAQLPPQTLLFPKKVYLSNGAHDGVYKGGFRDHYYYAITKKGTLTIDLEWKQDVSMMLITPTLHWKRIDGKSPLRITQEVVQDDVGKDLDISVGSFELPDGKQCPYRITLTFK